MYWSFYFCSLCPLKIKYFCTFTQEKFKMSFEYFYWSDIVLGYLYFYSNTCFVYFVHHSSGVRFPKATIASSVKL